MFPQLSCVLVLPAFRSRSPTSRQPLSSRSLMRDGYAMAHTPLPSPTVGAVIQPVCGPLLPPLVSSRSFHHVRIAAAHTVVNPCPAQTDPRYIARCPPAACAPFGPQPC